MQPGDLARIEFWDHCENGPDAMLFEVFGRIVDTSKVAYKIRCWGYVSDVDRASDHTSQNEHEYWIVKKAIKSIEIL